MQSVQELVDSLTLVGEPLGKNELTFHVLNALSSKYKKISATICARDTLISFIELHDKLVDYESSLKHNSSTYDISPHVTTNYANRGYKNPSFNRQEQMPLLKSSFFQSNTSGFTRSSPCLICQICGILVIRARIVENY